MESAEEVYPEFKTFAEELRHVQGAAVKAKYAKDNTVALELMEAVKAIARVHAENGEDFVDITPSQLHCKDVSAEALKMLVDKLKTQGLEVYDEKVHLRVRWNGKEPPRPRGE